MDRPTERKLSIYPHDQGCITFIGACLYCFLVIYGSERGFHAIDIESGSPYDLFLPSHQQPPIIPHAIVVLPV